MVEAMYDKGEEIFDVLRAEVLPYRRGAIDKLGSAIHEHGACRMEADPATRCWMAGTACTKSRTCLLWMDRPFRQLRRRIPRSRSWR